MVWKSFYIWVIAEKFQEPNFSKSMSCIPLIICIRTNSLYGQINFAHGIIRSCHYTYILGISTCNWIQSVIDSPNDPFPNILASLSTYLVSTVNVWPLTTVATGSALLGLELIAYTNMNFDNISK